jgi:hypothetical protein
LTIDILLWVAFIFLQILSRREKNLVGTDLFLLNGLFIPSSQEFSADFG